MERPHPRTCPLQEAAFIPTQDTSDGHPASVPAARLEGLLPPRSSDLPRPLSCQPRPPWGQTPRAQPPEPQGVCLPGHPDHWRQQLGDVERDTEPFGARVLTCKPELLEHRGRCVGVAKPDCRRIVFVGGWPVTAGRPRSRRCCDPTHPSAWGHGPVHGAQALGGVCVIPTHPSACRGTAWSMEHRLWGASVQAFSSDPLQKRDEVFSERGGFT